MWLHNNTEKSLSKADIKLIKSLQHAKVRREMGLFLVEGPKAVADFLHAFPCKLLVGSSEGYAAMLQASQDTEQSKCLMQSAERRILLPSDYDFVSVSLLKSPRPLLALFALPPHAAPQLPSSFALLLDDVQDPGNVGTIIRTCDWFGVRNVLLTKESADPFAPKVVQATMGSLARVGINPLDSPLAFLRDVSAVGIPILGTFLDGESLFYPQAPFPSLQEPAILVLGNEGKGISKAISSVVSRRITIPPSTSEDEIHSESLNVASAAAVFLTALTMHPLR